MTDYAANSIAYFLNQKLDTTKILLLLSGGSAIPMYDVLIEQLSKKNSGLHNLVCSLFDERWVLENSAESNEYQLKQIGFLDALEKKGGKWISYLSPQSESPSNQAHRISREFQKLLNEKHELVILAGIGEDGHTAGLLPTKNLETIKHVYESKNLVEYYELPPDTHNQFRKRITATPLLIKQAEQVFVYAPGDKKKTALKRFREKKEALSACPSLALHLSKHQPIILS